MLYEECETKIPGDSLSKVLSTVPGPACLIGGWAVYYTVNADYRASAGTSYQGSKDIDLGFHMEADATAEAMRESPLARACRSLEGMGFRGMGGRLFKEYHRETCLPLSEAKAKRTPSHNLFHLYVDLLVDHAPRGIKRAVGFAPFDEKLLVHVFRDGMFTMIDEFPAKVILPAPQVLLAMKMMSLPGRAKDHKRHKDVMDVYALIWHSGIPVQRLRSDLSLLVSSADMSRALSAIGGSDYEQAAGPLGIDPERLEAVISSFVRGGAPVSGRGGRGWPLPRNMPHGKLVLAAKTLLQRGADRSPVALEALQGTVGIGGPTLRQGLSFLESIGIACLRDGNRCVLTADGALYARAHSDGDARRIRSLTLDAIRRSHLADLADMAANNKGAGRGEICRQIKALGGYPDGKGEGGMQAPVAVGARTVLRLFEDAGLFRGGGPGRADAGQGGASGMPGSAAAPGAAGGRGRPERGVSAGAPPPCDVADMDDLAVLTVKGVGQVRINDLETVGVAEMYIDMLRKRMSGDSGKKGGKAGGSLA